MAGLVSRQSVSHGPRASSWRAAPACINSTRSDDTLTDLVPVYERVRGSRRESRTGSAQSVKIGLHFQVTDMLPRRKKNSYIIFGTLKPLQLDARAAPIGPDPQLC